VSERTKRRYPFRLVYQLMGILLLMSVLPLVFLSRKLMDINQKSLEDIILVQHTQAASRLRGSLEIFLDNLRKSLVETALLQGMTDVLNQAQRQGLLVNFLSSYDHIAGVKIYGVSGQEQLSATREQSAEETFQRLLTQRGGLGGREAEFRVDQPVTVPGSEVILLPVEVPVKSGRGEHLGTLLALVDLKTVQSMVGETRIGRRGSAFLVDRTGRVIAHRNQMKVKDRADLSRLEIVGSYVLTGRTGGTVPFVEEDGQEMLGAYDLIEEVGWGVVIEEPKSDAYRSLVEMNTQTIIWVSVVSILALALAAVTSLHISRPIRIFAEKALAVAKGDFRQSIKLKSRNEIGQLAETFNVMMRELDSYDRNNRELFLSTIKSLAAAVDAKDPYTRGHSDRVSQYSLAIARELGYTIKELEQLQIAALLHDVGKIGIDDSILRKPGKLSEEEYTIMKMHPVFGANIMQPIRQLRDIIPGMKHHHECFNGSGYPDGIRQEEIPMTARIIAVADVFDAMTSERPYQKAAGDEVGIKTLVRLSGIRYDPEVVKAFLTAYPSLGRLATIPQLDEQARATA
jgi:HD-GYP domain-containing protein (c-di-GMP phosphodiesterase class II)